MLGAILTIFVVYAFLNSWRSTLITALSLPTSVTAAFIAVWLCGFTLNFMTLLGLSLAIGDGALGFWGALREVFPDTREQRCWFHKIANVLAALPKSAHPGAKKALAEEKTIKEVVVEMGFVERGDLTDEQLDAALDVASMTHP